MTNAYADLAPTSPEMQAVNTPASGPANAYADLVPPEWKSSVRKQGADPYAVPKDSPASGLSEFDLTLAGLGQGLTNVARHAGNLVGLESDQDLKDAKALDAPLLQTPSGRFGGAAGEAAALVPATMGAEIPLGMTAAGARLLAAPVLRGVLEGAGQGATMADPGNKAAGAVIGGGAGLAFPAASSAAQRLANGLERTPEAQQLLDQGIRLTPGQMNPEGVFNKIEENVRAVPVVGNIIEHARTQSQQDFQRGVIQESAAPGYQLQNQSRDPNVLFQEAQDSYAPLYAQARDIPVTPHIYHPVTGAGPVRQPLADALDRAADLRTVGATTETREQARNFMDGQLDAFQDRAQAQGGWTSSHLIDLRSRINEEIRGAGQDQNGRSYAALLRQGRDRVTDAINSQIPADAAAALQTANDAYPRLAIIRDAIRRGGDQPTGFSPAQLSAAVKEASDNNAYARGGGLMRDWSSAGRDIFTERNPRTGASHGTTGSLVGAAYALHHFVPGAQIPAAVGTAGALGVIGTDAGRRFAAGQTAPQRATQRLIQGLQNITTPGQRETAGIASRAALNRAAALETLGKSPNNQQQ
jgi:hypothetical protein